MIRLTGAAAAAGFSESLQRGPSYFQLTGSGGEPCNWCRWLQAAQWVMEGDVPRSALAVVRPPGHHAECSAHSWPA